MDSEAKPNDRKNEEAAKIAIVFHSDQEKAFPNEFKLEEILEELAEIDNWKIDDFKLGIEGRDKNGEIIFLGIDLNSKKELEGFSRFEGRWVHYVLIYPVRNLITGQTDGEYPLILRVLQDTTAEELDEKVKMGESEMTEEMRRMYEGHTTKQVIAEYDVYWKPTGN